MKKLFQLIALAFLTCGMAAAQVTVAPFLTSNPQFLNTNGTPLNAGCVFTFAAGTTNPLVTYSDSAGTTPNANPVILNSGGFPSAGGIWLTSAAYKFVVKSAGGVNCASGGTITTTDGITWSTPSSTFAGIVSTSDVTLQQPAAATSGANQSSNNLKVQGSYWNGSGSAVESCNLQDILGTGTNPTVAFTLTCSGSSGATTFSVVPNTAFSGTISANGLASFPGGECYTFENGKAVVVVSAACGYTTWALALAACPSTGCIMDGSAPDVPLAMGAFDTGSNTKPVTVNLGPYNFTATQITVRQGLKLRGAGTLSTNITSVGTNVQPLLVNVQGNNNAITTEVSGMSLNALAGNTSQDGIFFDCSTLTNAGVELSRFDNLILNGFKGSVIHFKATQDGVSGSIGCTQGNTFTNVTAIRPTGATGATQNALRIEGGAGQFDFYNCWFDGQSSDTGTNVFVGTSGTQAPYSIHFHSTTNQNGFAYLFDGGTSITTEDDHFEVIKGAYNLANTSQLLVGLNFKRPHINSNVGVNAGNGYIVNVSNTVTNSDVTLDTPLVYATPDNLVKNAAGNAASIKVINARTFNSTTPANVYVSSGVTGTLAPAATVDLHSWNTVQATASGTSMTTFKSTLMPGETVTLYASGGSIQFATGGNLSLGTQTSPMVVPSGDSATFMRVDAGTPAFVLVALSTKTLTGPIINGTPTGTGIPTLTEKKGSGGGNYGPSASTTYVVVDSTNLCYTVTIPTGWKLLVTAEATGGTNTAAVAFFVAVTDNASCSTANAGIVRETATAGPSAGANNAATITAVINGDGASHNVALQFKTTNAADSVFLSNTSASFTPSMTFVLSPSN
jgi:hypothetical protein